MRSFSALEVQAPLLRCCRTLPRGCAPRAACTGTIEQVEVREAGVVVHVSRPVEGGSIAVPPTSVVKASSVATYGGVELQARLQDERAVLNQAKILRAKRQRTEFEIATNRVQREHEAELARLQREHEAELEEAFRQLRRELEAERKAELSRLQREHGEGQGRAARQRGQASPPPCGQGRLRWPALVIKRQKDGDAWHISKRLLPRTGRVGGSQGNTRGRGGGPRRGGCVGSPV